MAAQTEVLDRNTKEWLEGALARASAAAEKDAGVTATVALLCTLSWNEEMNGVEVKIAQREGNRCKRITRWVNGQLSLDLEGGTE